MKNLLIASFSLLLLIGCGNDPSAKSSKKGGKDHPGSTTTPDIPEEGENDDKNASKASKAAVLKKKVEEFQNELAKEANRDKRIDYVRQQMDNAQEAVIAAAKDNLGEEIVKLLEPQIKDFKNIEEQKQKAAAAVLVDGFRLLAIKDELREEFEKTKAAAGQGAGLKKGFSGWLKAAAGAGKAAVAGYNKANEASTALTDIGKNLKALNINKSAQELFGSFLPK